MSCCSSGSCGSGCAGCKVFMGIAALLTTVTTIASLVGVYMTHVTADGWVFGSLNGSVAILAFLASMMSWLKLVKKMCPCKSGGDCSGCHSTPCKC